MNKTFFYFLLVLTSLSANNDINQIFIEGNNHFINQKYDNAIKKYEMIINTGYQSSELYYNLGNAYFRNNNLGHSIWSYLKSLKLNPRYKDAAYNLLIARSRIMDQIKMPKTLFFIDEYRKLKANFTLNELILVTGIFFFSFSLITFLLKLQFLKSSFVYLCNKTLLISLIISSLVAIDVYINRKNESRGVVISQKIDAYSGPGYTQNIIIFRLNEGMIVEIKKINNDWLEIVLADGKKGWVSIDSVRII